jgi:hypothetical protein
MDEGGTLIFQSITPRSLLPRLPLSKEAAPKPAAAGRPFLGSNSTTTPDTEYSRESNSLKVVELPVYLCLKGIKVHI